MSFKRSKSHEYQCFLGLFSNKRSDSWRSLAWDHFEMREQFLDVAQDGVSYMSILALANTGSIVTKLSRWIKRDYYGILRLNNSCKMSLWVSVKMLTSFEEVHEHSRWQPTCSNIMNYKTCKKLRIIQISELVPCHSQGHQQKVKRDGNILKA